VAEHGYRRGRRLALLAAGEHGGGARGLAQGREGGAVMSADWTPEELAEYKAAHLRCTRLCQARNATRATTETRIALVAFERGISESEMEQFYFVNRKGAKKRHFNHEAFAKKYDVDIRWIWEGELCRHPRGLKPSKPALPPPLSGDEFVAAMASLDQDGRQFIIDYMNTLLAKRST
jgi:hypothetical protein